jgi:hypothetical protein
MKCIAKLGDPREAAHRFIAEVARCHPSPVLRQAAVAVLGFEVRSTSIETWSLIAQAAREDPDKGVRMTAAGMLPWCLEDERDRDLFTLSLDFERLKYEIKHFYINKNYFIYFYYVDCLVPIESWRVKAVAKAFGLSPAEVRLRYEKLSDRFSGLFRLPWRRSRSAE